MGKKPGKTDLRNREQEKQRRKQLLYQLKPLLWAFIAWFAINALIHLPAFSQPVRDFFVGFTTHAAYWFAKVLFIPAEMTQVPYLSVKGFYMQVVPECTAYNFYIFGITLVLFARWPWRHKLVNLGIILLGIFIMNNIRFVTMGYVGNLRPELFDPIHDYAWNILFGFMVFGIWAWRETAARKALLTAAQIKHAGKTVPS